MILAVSVTALVAGGVLSFDGYQTSSATITVTTVRSFLTSTTMTSSTVSSSRVATRTTRTEKITNIFNVSAAGGQYGCIHDEASATLDAGPIHMSFSTMGNASVDFWMLNTEQWFVWRGVTTCGGYRALPAIVSRIGVSHWESDVNVPLTGVYYFVFLNSNRAPVSISFSVTATHAFEATLVLGSTSYATRSSTWTTQTLETAQKSAGIGVIFYLGAAFLVIGVAMLLLYVRSRGRL